MGTFDLHRVAERERAGPSADRAVSVEVHLDARAASLAPMLTSSLKALCGEHLRVLDGLAHDNDVAAVGQVAQQQFPYERSPLPVRTGAGEAVLVSFLPLRSPGAPYPVVEAWREQTAEVVPLLLDRSALVCAGERLLVSEAVLDVNQRLPDDADADALRALGWRPRSVEVVKALLAEGLKRPRRDFLFVPAMPGDAAAHVSSWLLSFDDGLIVPEIDQAAFDAIGLVHEVALGRLVQTFLDVQAAELEKRGFAVERVPMMPPTHLVRAQHRGESWVGRCSSPTNGVLLDAFGKRTAYLPRPSSEGFPEGYQEVLAHALDAWRARFTRAGYEVVFVDDEPVKARGGCLRQLVASFPAP